MDEERKHQVQQVILKVGMRNGIYLYRFMCQLYCTWCCVLYLLLCVRDYLGRESQEKRQTAMDFDGWQFFAPKVIYCYQ